MNKVMLPIWLVTYAVNSFRNQPTIAFDEFIAKVNEEEKRDIRTASEIKKEFTEIVEIYKKGGVKNG